MYLHKESWEHSQGFMGAIHHVWFRWGRVEGGGESGLGTVYFLTGFWVLNYVNYFNF